MRSVVSVLASVLLAVGLVPTSAWAVAGEGAAHAAARTGLLAAEPDIAWYLDGIGDDDFTIGRADELRGLSALVNGTARDGSAPIAPVSFEGATIRLGSGVSGVDLAGAPFVPIGSPDHPFAGTFDGNGKEISGLKVEGVTEYAALFGYTSATSAVKDVHLAAGSQGGVTVEAHDGYAGCIGSLAGQADGLVSGCTSDVPVRVNSTSAATAEHPYIVQRVGGLVGYARSDMIDCSYTGELNVQVASDTVEGDTSSESLRVADSFGGLVGRFGDPDCHGTLRGSHNLGDVTVQTSGAGAKDRFGTTTYACVFFVGGLVGYSNGSIIDCYNGAYDELTQTVTGKVFTGVYREGTTEQVPANLVGNRGADQTGGIVGGLRSVSDDPDRYNDGDPNDPMIVRNCHNEAQVTGLVAVGGIVGETGVYCTVTQCYNGTVSDLTDWTRNQIAGKVVSTRWNKPFTAGIVGQTRSGTVSYCANYAEIRNVQTGYYTSGIAGCIFVSDDYPNVTGEIYACFNSGGIYTVSESVEFREAGICGDNEGYVHDCIVMRGSVPHHDDSAIGNNDWGAYGNLVVKSPSELASPESAALLNAIASQNQDWSCYWFVNKAGYPVLNTWVVPDRITLTAANVASAVQVAPAPWVGRGASSVPQLKVTLADGTVLVQDTDFRVIAQEGAYEMNASPVYRASIEGLGLYRGTVVDCASYSIGACDLSRAVLRVPSAKYGFGKVVLPEQVQATIYGTVIDEAQLDYVIYNSTTTEERVESGGGFAVFDSRGYISYTADGAVLYPVSEVSGGMAALNAETRDWWLWDRNGEVISDSAGNSYYTATSGGGIPGAVVGANTSCVNLKSGSPAGYVVKVAARDESAVAFGSVVGRYVIDPIDLYRECTFEQAVWNGQVWLWDMDKAAFYLSDDGGVTRDYAVCATFTGETIQPSCAISYQGRPLAEGVDFRVLCGDPDPASSGEDSVVVSEGAANRNVTGTFDDGEGGEVTVRAAITSTPVNKTNLSNYVISYFDIVPAALEDCYISLASDEWAWTGEQVKPPVKVELNGVELVEGVDYQVAYANNVDMGEASYTVSALRNLSGGGKTEFTGAFQIVEGIDLSAYEIDPIADQQFNWGCDVHPALVFRSSAAEGSQVGEAVDLAEGADYRVSYSTRNVTKRSDGTLIDPCTLTVTGIGKYTGSTTAEFHIVPYDAAANATGQLKAYTQDLVYGTWGVPSTVTVTDADGAKIARDAPANVGPDYPVIAVQARPIVDWNAYDGAVAAGADPEDAGCYGEPLAMGTANNNVSGGLVNRFAGRYYDEGGNEVNGNGAVYADSSGAIFARPSAAEPGSITAKVELRCGTGGAKNGAVGMLDCGTVQYMAPAPLSSVRWSSGAATGRVYAHGEEVRPVTGAYKGSGFTLEEGRDYEIEYSHNTDAGVATYTVSAMGDGKYLEGSYTGSFSILPLDISAAEGFEVSLDSASQVLSDAAAGAMPEPVVMLGDAELVKGRDYVLSYVNNHAPGDAAAVYVTGTGNYTGTMAKGFAIVAPSTEDPDPGSVSDPDPAPGESDLAQADPGSGGSGSAESPGAMAGGSLEGATVAISATSFAYDGSVRKPVVTSVKIGATELDPSSYTVSYVNSSHEAVASPKNAGTYFVQVTGKSPYTGSASVPFKIMKGANKLVVKAVKKVLSAPYGKRTAIAASKAFEVVKNAGKGKVAYKKKSGNAKIAVSGHGKVTVKKGLKPGKYPVKVAVTSKATANYNARTVAVAFKVKVA